MEKNDVVEIHFDMLPRLVKANEKVAADRGRVAVSGPVVYCAEWPDNDFNVHTLLMNRRPNCVWWRGRNCCTVSIRL